MASVQLAQKHTFLILNQTGIMVRLRKESTADGRLELSVGLPRSKAHGKR